MQTIDVITYFDCTPTGTKSYRKLQNGYADNSEELHQSKPWMIGTSVAINNAIGKLYYKCVSLEQTQPIDMYRSCNHNDSQENKFGIQLLVLNT